MLTYDLHDLADEWQDALDLIDNDAPDDYALERETAEDIAALASDLLGGDPTPSDLRAFSEKYDSTLILESDFEEYARDYAEEIGAVPVDARWPCNAIDWERAADELAMDYTSVEFRGDTYLIRG